jgi:hypothetical protein
LKKTHPYYWIVGEIAVVFLYLLLLNNFLGRKEVVIVADGKGYYDYLPATFIYKDLNFGYTDTLVSEYYNHREYNQGINPVIEGKRINKYFIGTALVQVPFFLTAHFIASTNETLPADGYSSIYQDFVFYSALFYAFLGLFFLRKSMNLMGLQPGWIIALQLVTIFATSLMHYLHAEASFSHVYSFAFISCFVYLVFSYRLQPTTKKLYIAALVLGIILLIRPVNILVLLFVPFLHDSFGEFLWTMRQIIQQWKKLLVSIGIFSAIVFLQPLVWFIQTGNFYIRPYGDETFHLAQPHIVDFLFSYQKGFFLYAPVFFVGIILGIYAGYRRTMLWHVISFLAAFIVLVYILSSWWTWIYGASYGSRVMIDYYPVIILFIASFFMTSSFWFKLVSSAVLLSFSYVSIIQTYQYQNYILHWTEMNQNYFWKVFLQTEEKYHGIFWQPQFDFSKGIEIASYDVDENQLKKLENGKDGTLLSKTTELFGHANYVVSVNLKLDSPLGEDKVLVVWDDSAGVNHYYYEMHVFKGTQQTNYRGNVKLNFAWRPTITDSYTLKVLYTKNEKDSWLKEAKITLTEMP